MKCYAYLCKFLTEEIPEDEDVDFEWVVGNVVRKLRYLLVQTVRAHDKPVRVFGLQPRRDTEIDIVVGNWHVVTR